MGVILGSRHMTIPAGAVTVRGARGAAAAAAWWVVAGKTCVVAYQPKGAASLAASYSNLAQPGTYDAALGVAPTWDAGTGWTFDGTTQWLDTGLLPTADISCLLRFANAAGGSGGYTPAIASYSGNETTRFALMPNYAGNMHRYYEHGGTLNLNASAVPTGVMAVSGQQGYLDGIADGSAISGWSGTATVTVGIGRQNGYNAFANVTILAVVFYASALTAAQVATVSAAMAAL